MNRDLHSIRFEEMQSEIKVTLFESAGEVLGEASQPRFMLFISL